MASVPADDGRPGRATSDRLALLLRLLSIGPLASLIALVVLVSVATPGFLGPLNMANVLSQTAVIAVVAMGQQLVILTRGIDLSVGSNLALSTVIGGLVFHGGGGAVPVALAILGTGTLVGLINGMVFVYGRLPHPFIITLATLSICRGLALALAPGHTTLRGMPDAIAWIGEGTVAGIPVSAWIVLGTAGVLWLLTHGLVAGRWIYAVGGSPDAARTNGIPVQGVLVAVYAICGFCCGLGALILSGRTAAASPLFGNLLELDTIAAVIIGGASFLGGRGHIGHALIGAMLIGVIRNALNLQNVEVFYQMIAIGVIIVLAVEADVFRSRLEARLRTVQSQVSP